VNILKRIALWAPGEALFPLPDVPRTASHHPRNLLGTLALTRQKNDPRTLHYREWGTVAAYEQLQLSSHAPRHPDGFR